MGWKQVVLAWLLVEQVVLLDQKELAKR